MGSVDTFYQRQWREARAVCDGEQKKTVALIKWKGGVK